MHCNGGTECDSDDTAVAVEYILHDCVMRLQSDAVEAANSRAEGLCCAGKVSCDLKALKDFPLLLAPPDQLTARPAPVFLCCLLSSLALSPLFSRLGKFRLQNERLYDYELHQLLHNMQMQGEGEKDGT